MALLEVKNVDIHYKTEKGTLHAISNISFKIEEGERLGLVGESGCGKTTMAKALMMLLPDNGFIPKGQILFKGEDLVQKSKEEIRKLRWKDISMIAQSAMNALNPVYRVGDQLMEAMLAHSSMSKEDARHRAGELFELVGLERKRLRDYPHQMSGGMKQRAIIAMALALNPALIIADEPTTALDVVVQDRILNKIIQIQREINSSMVFITHDISVVSETCNTIIVMYGGKIMEKASTRQFFKNPYHPYSLGLQNAFPSLLDMGEELISIPGSPPNLLEPKPGCYFQERCPFATDRCREEAPELHQVEEEHSVACHYIDEVERFRAEAKKRESWDMVRDRLIAARTEG
ncbi:ABC transporter ATP-binding protein [Bacillus horti]|uniref:Peptide/nickel transport system ATP-binding protein n=1 Tax=Caldalkalibacillus horti TaxID=77523 RepID=A0ABT9VW67_9BACI|nr:ABC transporter ATP-binding protein [Bacillus horti]MDQ0164865.1 peptide/nickel transport system ATP-binding protein [Bacillus horti]